MNRLKVGRNDPCPCGSGKKYKRCCGAFEEVSKNINKERPIKERNMLMVKAIDDIFGFSKGTTWDAFRTNITDEQVREFYEFFAWLWPLDTDIMSLLPSPSNTLRGLYIGEMRAQSIVDNVCRYCLYTDEIVVVNPIQHPLTYAEEYSPLVNPYLFKQDMIELVYLILSLYRWFESDVVLLIPDPTDFNIPTKKAFWKMAEDSWLGKKDELDALVRAEVKDKKPESLDMLLHTLARAPREYQIERIKQFNPEITEEQLQSHLDYLHHQFETHPLWLNQPFSEGTRGELYIKRMGANMELGLYIAQLTGSYIYTNSNFQWYQLQQTQNLTTIINQWTPLTKAFQELDFNFLDKADPSFVVNLRIEERLSSFRNYLRRVWNVTASSVENYSDERILGFKDELVEEYGKAKEEWKDIDRDLRNWITPKSASLPVILTGVSAILQGSVDWKVPAMGFALEGVTKLLKASDTRQRFRKNVPLSILIDLENKKRRHPIIR